MEQTIENGKRQAQRAVNQATDVVKDFSSKGLMESAKDWYGTAKPMINDITKKSQSVTRRYPLQAILGAALFGFIFAALFRRRVTE